MIKTRSIKGTRVFYDSLTGVTLNSIKAVSIAGVQDTIVTVVNKDNELWIYLPQREGVPLVKLVDAVERMDLIITKVA